jgi:hypothetical protein
MWQFNPSSWVDGPPGTGTVPHAQDFKNIATDVATLGGSLDGAAYPVTNLGYLLLNRGALPGSTYTVTAASWSSSGGGVATFTIGSHFLLVGQLISLAGATPTGFNFTLVPVTAITSTTVSVAMSANPGTWTSGGSIEADGVAASTGIVKFDSNQNLRMYGTAGLAGWGRVIFAVGTVSLTGQGASIGATAILNAALSGLYRISIAISVTTAATTSSTLPSVTIGYSQQESGAAISVTPIASSSSNSTSNVQQATLVCPVQAGANITYATSGYASSGATSMQYSLHIDVEFLG